MIRKLVIYRDEETLKAQAPAYPCLWIYHAQQRRGEFDDGVGNFGHVDFAVVSCNEDLAKLPRKHKYDVIELVGFDTPAQLL